MNKITKQDLDEIVQDKPFDTIRIMLIHQVLYHGAQLGVQFLYKTEQVAIDYLDIENINLELYDTITSNDEVNGKMVLDCFDQQIVDIHKFIDPSFETITPQLQRLWVEIGYDT